MLEPLYRRSLDGIEIWSINVEGNKLIVNWGKYKGKTTTRETVIKEGKNIGKSNETSSYLQAEKEAISKWKKKVEREGYYSITMLGYEPQLGDGQYEEYTGYFLPVNRTLGLYLNPLTLDEVLLMLPAIGNTNSGKLLPMLAKKFYKEDKIKVPRLPFPILVQPKYNGVRCLMRITPHKIRLFSREGLEYKVPVLIEKIMQNLDHLYYILASQLEIIDESEIVLDGELYIHNTILSDIVSAVKKSNLLTPLIGFYCYDIAIEDIDQKRRLQILKTLNPTDYAKVGLYIVHTKVCRSIDEAEQMCTEYINTGFEGLIGRNPLGFYQFGARSKDLVKLKVKQSEEFKIIDVYDTDKQPGLAMFKCKNNLNNEYFEVVPEGTHGSRKQLLNNRNQLIGKMLTVEFYERTAAPKEVPFHATGITIRDYE